MKFKNDILPYIIIVIAVVVIRTFIVTPVIVDGDSMNNTLKDGQVLLLKKHDKSLKRNDIIVFNYNGSKLVKRVIGLPGEHVSYKDGVLYINGIKTGDSFSNITNDYDLNRLGIETIPEGYYFVLGDNRNHSSDSRMIGLVSIENISGVTNFSLWPLKTIK